MSEIMFLVLKKIIIWESTSYLNELRNKSAFDKLTTSVYLKSMKYRLRNYIYIFINYHTP